MLYQEVYVDAWLSVTPNSSRMTGLLTALPDAAWSLIHCVPKPTGSVVCPQLSCRQSAHESRIYEVEH